MIALPLDQYSFFLQFAFRALKNAGACERKTEHASR